jgi:dihydropteroate synthase
MIWQHRRGAADLSRHGLIMGVLNVTPDSFSDGGSSFDPAAALNHARELIADGADIIDVGGESTRPGSDPVSVEEEIRRVCPVIRAVRAESDVLISIDTSKALVAEEAVKAGADIINDVTGLTGDPAMPEVAARSGAGIVLMHMQGEPRTMQVAPHYEDVVAEVREFLRQRISLALSYGMVAERLAIDPGIGFGKTQEHNLALLRETGRFAELDRPVLIGVSRKSFLGRITGSTAMEDRAWPAVAITSFCREAGAHIFRVHEPKPHREALRMTEAILHA